MVHVFAGVGISRAGLTVTLRTRLRSALGALPLWRGRVPGRVLQSRISETAFRRVGCRRRKSEIRRDARFAGEAKTPEK